MEIDRSDQLCDLTHNPFFFEIFQSPKFVSTKEEIETDLFETVMENFKKRAYM